MESKIVRLKDVTNENPTLCISTLRFTNHCYQCRLLRMYEDLSLAEIPKKLKCKPHFTKKAFDIWRKRLELLKKQKEIEDELKVIDQKLDKC